MCIYRNKIIDSQCKTSERVLRWEHFTRTIRTAHVTRASDGERDLVRRWCRYLYFMARVTALTQHCVFARALINSAGPGPAPKPCSPYPLAPPLARMHWHWGPCGQATRGRIVSNPDLGNAGAWHPPLAWLRHHSCSPSGVARVRLGWLGQRQQRRGTLAALGRQQKPRPASHARTVLDRFACPTLARTAR